MVYSNYPATVFLSLLVILCSLIILDDVYSQEDGMTIIDAHLTPNGRTVVVDLEASQEMSTGSLRFYVRDATDLFLHTEDKFEFQMNDTVGSFRFDLDEPIAYLEISAILLDPDGNVIDVSRSFFVDLMSLKPDTEENIQAYVMTMQGNEISSQVTIENTADDSRLIRLPIDPSVSRQYTIEISLVDDDNNTLNSIEQSIYTESTSRLLNPSSPFPDGRFILIILGVSGAVLLLAILIKPNKDSVEQNQISVFISYRRAISSGIAQFIHDELEDRGIDAYLDTMDIGKGEFELYIQQYILDADYFLLVLTQNTLESDWVKKEIEIAIQNDKEIIPIAVDKYDISKENLPNGLSELRKMNTVKYLPEYREAALKRLIEFINPD